VKGILWPIIRTNTSVPRSSMPRITVGGCERLEHERIFGGDCIVRNEIAMDARGPFIQLRVMPKITRKIFGGPLIGVHTNRLDRRGDAR
jgi:hypothetical protein